MSVKIKRPTQLQTRRGKGGVGDAIFNRSFGLLVNNFIAERARLTAALSSDSDGHRGCVLDPPGRDLDRECGYPSNPTIYHYKRLYDRNDFANRVVNIWPDECWARRPEVYETEDVRVTKFERALNKLVRKVGLWHYLHRADRLCGIGGFGVLLLGLDDGRKLTEPAAGIDSFGRKTKKRPKKPVNLIYLRAFSQENVQIAAVETDRANPRYGQPTIYNITVISPTVGDGEAVMDTLRVHWSRVLHFADNRESSEVDGIARLRPVLNRILDLRKLLSASAEMFYKGGFPGYSFETIPELLGESTLDEESVRTQFEEYMDGLKRYLALDGVTAKTLFPQVADPTAHVMQQLTAICATIGVPLRIFLGTESGHLASSQDSLNWNKRVGNRQEGYLEPHVIRPAVDRFIALGILPEVEDYLISWRDLNTMSDEAKADVSLKRAQALMQYVSGQLESVVPPQEFLTMFMGFSPEEAESMIAAVKAHLAAGERYTPLPEPTAGPTNNPKPGNPKPGKIKIVPQGGGRTGNAPKGNPHRTAGRRVKKAAA